MLPAALTVRSLLIDAHILAEQAVTADIAEARQFLSHFQLLLIFLLQSQTHTAGAYAEIGVVMKSRLTFRGNVHLLLHDQFLPASKRYLS